MDNIALFDMDESLAGYVEALVRDLEAISSPTEEPITSENIWKMERSSYIQARMRLIKSQPGWWLNLKPIERGMDVLSFAKNLGFKIQILTKGPKIREIDKISTSWNEKVQWCLKHLGPDVGVTVVSDVKNLTYGKLLYDDYVPYMDSWLANRPRGLGIMPVTPENKDYSHPQVIRYNGLEDIDKVMRAMRKCYEREPKQELDLDE